MAEKEEKTKDIIYVFSQQLICKDCKDWYEHIDPLDKPDCDNCEDIADLPHISRQEAIERMAKAFFKSWYGEGFEQEDTDLKIRYRESAEAALNALLEGK